jgi:hypothetical protein
MEIITLDLAGLYPKIYMAQEPTILTLDHQILVNIKSERRMRRHMIFVSHLCYLFQNISQRKGLEIQNLNFIFYGDRFDDDEFGALCGMRSGRRNRSTWKNLPQCYLSITNPT